MDALKAEQTAATRWRVLAIPFGGPFAGGKDFDGEFFSRNTDIKARWFSERPVLFHHGGDQTVKDADLGVQELDPEPGSDGWWSTVWLNRSERYWAQVDALLRAGKMFGSSGALAHLVKKNRESGEILVWPHIEQTLTPTPANPLARITASKALAGFSSAGIALDDSLKSVLAELDVLVDDLRPDLPSGGAPLSGYLPDGGEDVATRRLDALEAALTRLREVI